MGKRSTFILARRKMRLAIVQILFSKDFWDNFSFSEAEILLNRDLEDEELAYLSRLEEELTGETRENEKNLSESQRHQILDYLKGIGMHREEIDTCLRESLTKGSVERIAPIDLAILRLALYEIFYVETIHPSVAINEAVEIAKVMGTEHSPKFINGLLGSVVREAEE